MAIEVGVERGDTVKEGKEGESERETQTGKQMESTFTALYNLYTKKLLPPLFPPYAYPRVIGAPEQAEVAIVVSRPRCRGSRVFSRRPRKRSSKFCGGTPYRGWESGDR